MMRHTKDEAANQTEGISLYIQHLHYILYVIIFTYFYVSAVKSGFSAAGSSAISGYRDIWSAD